MWSWQFVLIWWNVRSRRRSTSLVTQMMGSLTIECERGESYYNKRLIENRRRRRRERERETRRVYIKCKQRQLSWVELSWEKRGSADGNSNNTIGYCCWWQMGAYTSDCPFYRTELYRTVRVLMPTDATAPAVCLCFRSRWDSVHACYGTIAQTQMIRTVHLAQWPNWHKRWNNKFAHAQSPTPFLHSELIIIAAAARGCDRTLILYFTSRIKSLQRRRIGRSVGESVYPPALARSLARSWLLLIHLSRRSTNASAVGFYTHTHDGIYVCV